MKEIKGVRKKIVDIMTLIFGIGVFAALIVGALSFFGYVVAIIIGGETATEICKVIYKSIYPILFTFSSCVVLFGLVKMYVAGEKALDNKKKKKFSATSRQGKKLLILGANPETVSLVVKANKMGYKTYVTDYNPNAYAKKFASVPCNIDGMNADELTKFVQEEKIDAVLVGVAEALIPTYCEVCKRLNIPCFASLEQFDIMIHKDKFKSTCREHGVPVVEEYSVLEPDKVKYPAIVKPVDSSSSYGISICNNREELDVAIEKALSFSPSKTILIEKYMDGIEAIVYYVIQDGKPSLVAMCDRYTSKEQEGITQLPSAYIFPSKHLDKYIKETDEKVCNMLKGMGIQNGVLFLQAFIDDGSVRIYEPGFRLNGAQEHMIVSALTGIDAKELLINYALTGKMSEVDISALANPTFNGKWACKLSPLVKEGVIGKIEGVEEIKAIEGVVDVYPNYDDGGEVKGLGTQRQMLANIFIVADTKEELKERTEKVIDAVKCYDVDGNDMLLKPFNTEIIIEEYN
ncbi:MAG: ATP-grasp domain-containing protein [Clostridiales bacterium]|nr:ATP-grasp domain-containing protein [Clostridiales bacterium]